MLLEEAIWIQNQIDNYFNVDDFPLLNLGSSTKNLERLNKVIFTTKYFIL